MRDQRRDVRSVYSVNEKTHLAHHHNFGHFTVIDGFVFIDLDYFICLGYG